MKKHKLKIIIALMSAAVVGLILVQIYWISNMIRVEEEQFQKSVFTALMETAGKLQKKEAAHNIINKISGGKNRVVLMLDDNSKGKTLNMSDSGKSIRVVKIETNGDKFNYTIKYSSSDSIPHSIKSFSNYFVKSPTVSSVAVATFNDKSNKKQALVQNILTEMVDVASKKKIEERVNVSELDKTLHEQLKNQGIETDFYFAVDNTSNKTVKDTLVLIKAGTDTVELKKSKFRMPLFPMEIFSNENQLVLYFPHQKSYVIKSIAGMLSLSVGLILIIIGVFYKTVEMFVKQKKITDVKNDLINNITHEFKTPISTISLACEALNEPNLLVEKNSISRFSSIIKEENDRLKIMVDSLLNAAAMEKDEISLTKENVDMHEVICSVATKFSETIKSKNGKLTLNLNAEDFIITGDEFHLTNIIANLIDNAVKYNDREPEIIISTRNDNRNILITIKDNGIGISKEHLTKIFETFFRVASGNIQNVRGNGIGLSYVKKIIEAHTGTINVTSTSDLGSEFIINLPTNSL
jgi:two-component system, OmpR family, phosphate regulon sensor histidine kinase PhoR